MPFATFTTTMHHHQSSKAKEGKGRLEVWTVKHLPPPLSRFRAEKGHQARDLSTKQWVVGRRKKTDSPCFPKSKRRFKKRSAKSARVEEAVKKRGSCCWCCCCCCCWNVDLVPKNVLGFEKKNNFFWPQPVSQKKAIKWIARALTSPFNLKIIWEMCCCRSCPVTSKQTKTVEAFFLN